MKLGATGRFPSGKLGPHDEGELNAAVAHDAQGRVHIDFGTPVVSVAMPREVAVEFARLVLKHCGAKSVEVKL